MTTYYAVTNANGPISVRLEADSLEDVWCKYFGFINTLDSAPHFRKWIDECRTEAELDLGIEGEGMSEEDFADALEENGAVKRLDFGGEGSKPNSDWQVWAIKEDS